MPAMPAMPLTGDVHTSDQGLTKLEECVFRAMQGLLSNQSLEFSHEQLADEAIMIAYAVMDKLEK